MINRLVREVRSLVLATILFYPSEVNVNERKYVEVGWLEHDCNSLVEWYYEEIPLVPMDWYPERDEVIRESYYLRREGYSSVRLEDCVNEIKYY